MNMGNITKIGEYGIREWIWNMWHKIKTLSHTPLGWYLNCRSKEEEANGLLDCSIHKYIL